MFLSTKEIIFFVLTFLVLFFFSKSALYLGPKLKLGNTVTLLVTSFVGVLLLLLVYKFGKIAHCQADQFHFEVSKPKLCAGYPYMQSSASPEVQDYCRKLFSTPEGRAEFAQMNCPTGYNGRPVHWNRTPMSNDMWENEMCNPPYLNLNDPCVL